MVRNLFLFFTLVTFFLPAAHSQSVGKTATSVFGSEPMQKSSLHRQNYFIFGEHDLKLQFSFKYRLARSLPLYLAYTQLMFWNIYEESKPFRDVNYSPEVFYRLLDKSGDSLQTLDLGLIHLSNGNEELDSRSLDRIFARANYFTKIKRHDFVLNLMLFHIYNEDVTNQDIVNHLGYWELSTMLTKLIIFEDSSLNLEFRTYAGSKFYDLDKGATQIGLLWVFKSENFNPSVYLQRFEGYSESLLGFNQRRTEYRLGLNLTF